MDKNKIIIIALIAIIAALLVGWVAMMPNTNKQNTKLTFESNSTITVEDSLKIKLTDENGTGLVNKEVNITFIDDKNRSDYRSIVTDDNGVGTLELDKSAGNYTIVANYAGNENYNECNATKKITIEEEVVEEQVAQQSTQTSSSSSSSSQNSLNYDSDLNVYYDSNGMIVDPDGQHGQAVGMSYKDAVELSKVDRN